MTRALTVLLALVFAAPVWAEGDAAAGENVFKRCKTCHMIKDLGTGEVIVKGNKTGPNLWGIIGSQAGTVEGFKYGDDLVAAGEAGLVWTEANLAEFSADPKAFLRTYLDDNGAKSRMSFKLRKGGADVAAYLATFGPAPSE